MRRWNGWGDDSVHFPVPLTALAYLSARLGEGEPYPDADFEQVLRRVPDSRLPEHPLVDRSAEGRLRHARGQSLPDWVALRSGEVGAAPDGVAYPTGDVDVRALIRYARQVGCVLIPYGGGTSVVGHINPIADCGPALTVDLARMSGLLDFDETSRLATFGAGTSGPTVEKQLGELGYTLGHYPQSFEFSTVGGWIATRSSGQQSAHYGRIEGLFAGGHVESPAGDIELPCLPASAAGPDLRQLILGSEGRFGIITRATLRVRPLPQEDAFYAFFFREWESGVEAVRKIIQAGAPVCMLRLSDAQETETTFILSGKERLVSLADKGLGALGYRGERCMLVYGTTGDRAATHLGRSMVREAAREHGGLYAGETIGKMWRKSRFLTPYLRNTLWEGGYAVDTLETALPWSKVLAAAEAIKAALRDCLGDSGERVLAQAHLSHVYPDGASVYVTYLFRRSQDPQETLERWKRLKTVASRVIVRYGGTISHQHGVGIDHAAYLESEKGTLGMAALAAVGNSLDPDGMMNPGKLIM